MSDDGAAFRPTDEMLSDVGWWRSLNESTIAEFEATGGNPGGPFEGKPMLLLHTVGRKTSIARVNPLNYWVDGDRILVQAAKGGYRSNPEWFLNLVANPDVEVTIGVERISVRSEVVPAGEQYDRDWTLIAAQAPIVDVVQGWTERVVPIVAFRSDM